MKWGNLPKYLWRHLARPSRRLAQVRREALPASQIRRLLIGTFAAIRIPLEFIDQTVGVTCRKSRMTRKNDQMDVVLPSFEKPKGAFLRLTSFSCFAWQGKVFAVVNSLATSPKRNYPSLLFPLPLAKLDSFGQISCLD